MAAATEATHADAAAETNNVAAPAASAAPPVASALLVVAPGDSIAPAVLLSVGTVAQYLFNCPESYSRLSLEHRCRPSAALRACFATSASPARALGGLGGLLMRLRADGHGELRVVGPRGTEGAACSLRHLLRWRHPTVFVDEVEEWCAGVVCEEGGTAAAVAAAAAGAAASLPPPLTPPPVPKAKAPPPPPPALVLPLRSVYRDDLIDVVAAWTGEREWAIPSWMRGAQGGDSSSSSSDDDDDDDESSSSSSSSSESDEDSSASSSSSSSSDSEQEGDGRPPPPPPPALFRDPLPPRERDYELCHGGPSPLYAEAAERSDSGGGEGASSRSSSSSSSSSPSIWCLVVHIPRAGATLLVVDCATEEAFESARRHPLSEWLLSSSASQSQSSPSSPSTSTSSSVSAIVHLTREAVAETPEYREWARGLAGGGCAAEGESPARPLPPPPSVLASLVALDESSPSSSSSSPASASSSSSSSFLGHLSSARTLARLSTVDPVVFPRPRGIVSRPSPSPSPSPPPPPPKGANSPLSPPSFYPGRLMLRVNFFASKGGKVTATVDESQCVPAFDPEAVVEAMKTRRGGKGSDNGEEAAAASPAVEPDAKRPKRQGEEEESPAGPAPSTGSASNRGAAAALRARLKPQPSSSNGGDKSSRAAAETAATPPLLPPPPPPPPLPPPPPPPLAPPSNAAGLLLPTLFFLGTGSAEPSAHRGASAMFLDVPLESSSAAAAASSAGILFDAGEGTAGALAKACGGSGSGSSSRSVSSLLPSSLRAVWLSHRHADHVLGLLGVLEARREEMMMMMMKKKKKKKNNNNNKDGVVLLPPPLLVVGPHSVGRWLAEASAAAGWNDNDTDNDNDENPSSSLPLHTPPLYRFASASSLYQRHDPEGGRRELESALGLEAWVPVRADHCSDAHGAVLWSKKKTTENFNLSSSSSSSLPSSWSLAVSGDTVPTEGFARASRGVDLLVHEATFASGEGGEAHAARKRHSTVAGALGVAAASGAKRTILTHFSQRYPGLPPDALQAPEQWDAARAVAAADGMAVRFADLGRLEGLTGRTVDALGDDDADGEEGEKEGKGGGGGGEDEDRDKSFTTPAADDEEDYYEDDCCCDGD